MTQTHMTLIGNLVEDPEIRFTPSGTCVVNFRIASTPRKYDSARGEWVDAETIFMTCSVWRAQAENVADSLAKGTRVIVTGKLKARSYETSAGERRTVMEIDVEEVGPSLRYATADVAKKSRTNDANLRGGWSASRDEARPSNEPRGEHRREHRREHRNERRPAASGDPWATPAPRHDPDDPLVPATWHPSGRLPQRPSQRLRL